MLPQLLTLTLLLLSTGIQVGEAKENLETLKQEIREKIESSGDYNANLESFKEQLNTKINELINTVDDIDTTVNNDPCSLEDNLVYQKTLTKNLVNNLGQAINVELSEVQKSLTKAIKTKLTKADVEKAFQECGEDDKCIKTVAKEFKKLIKALEDGQERVQKSMNTLAGATLDKIEKLPNDFKKRVKETLESPEKYCERQEVDETEEEEEEKDWENDEL